MNLNDFVVLPNNKARSVKLNARNLQELKMETVTLAQESTEMEVKLLQLKKKMSKEKEERGHSGGFRWKSGQRGSLNCNALTNRKNAENRFQKLSAGKLKIRVLSDEPLTAVPHPPPPPPPPTVNQRARRKNRLSGTYCGQCEAKTAGLACAECSEDFCLDCFTRFHQKGAMRLHRIIPIQTDLKTHVSSRDVVSCLRKQEMAVNHGEEKMEEQTEEGLNGGNERGFPTALLQGEYNEEESARSFQEAVKQWRDERSDRAGGEKSEEAAWTPVQPVTSTATQADLASDDGRRKVPVRVVFTENGLAYMDRLLLKEHRRTPITTYHSLAFGTDLSSQLNTDSDEEPASGLTAQEEDFRRYCASLFAVPVSRGRTEPQITTPESCLVIEVLDEEDKHGDLAAGQRTDDSRKVSSIHQVHSQAKALESQPASTSDDPSRVNHSSPNPTLPAQPKAARKLCPSKPKTSHAEPTKTSSPSKSKPSARPPAEAPRTLKTSIRTPSSTLQNCPPTVHKSKPGCGSQRLLSSPSSPRSQTELSRSAVSFPPGVSPPASVRAPVRGERLSPPPSSLLRSTFTLSPSGSTESTFLPKVYQSTPLLEQLQHSFVETASSRERSHCPPSNLEVSRQFQRSPESLLLDNQQQLPLSPVSPSHNPPPESQEPGPPVKSLSSLHLFEECGLSARESTKEDVLLSSRSICDEHESTLSCQDGHCFAPLPSHTQYTIHNPLVGKEEDEEELSIDSGDEMSSDSLGLAPLGEDSSDEEAQTRRRFTGGRSREKRNPATSHVDDCFVPGDAGQEKDLQTDEREQLSEPSVVMHRQRAESEPEQFSDLDGFPPPGLDMNSGHCETPEHTHCGSPHRGSASSSDSEPTGSGGYCPSPRTEEHLVSRAMKVSLMPPPGTTPTWRTQTSATEAAASAKWSDSFGESTQTAAVRPLSRAVQEIMEICSVDQTGCEDPDLDTDTTKRTLCELEQDLIRMAKETKEEASLRDCTGRQTQRGTRFTRSRVSEEQKDEEAAAQSDRQSVLLLP